MYSSHVERKRLLSDIDRLYMYMAKAQEHFTNNFDPRAELRLAREMVGYIVERLDHAGIEASKWFVAAINVCLNDWYYQTNWNIMKQRFSEFLNSIEAERKR